MRHFLTFLLSATAALPAAAQGLTAAGGPVSVAAGAVLYVGAGGLSNQAGATLLLDGGTLRVDGPLANAGTLNLGTGTLDARADLTNTGTVLPGTGTLTVAGPTDQLLTPGGATFYQVVVNKPTAGANTLRLAGNLTVSNALTLTSGLVSTQNAGTLYTLRLPAGASLSGEAAGRYVQGALEVTRNAVSGNTAVSFGHGAVLNPAGSNLGSVTITRVAGLNTADVSFGQNLGTPSRQGIDQLWTVAPATQPSAAVQLTLSWLPDNDHGLTDFSQARGWQQPAAGQPWAAVGAPANASSRSLTLAPTVLNRFTVSNAANPLPVTLVDFAAQPEGPAAVRLRWVTASERDNAAFVVERSLDGQVFAALGTVAGAGTSSARHAYSWLDAQLPAGVPVLYYRLRQVDFDGTATLSPVQVVALAASAPRLVLYPNPAREATTAAGLIPGAAVAVFDATGRRVAAATADAAGLARLLLPAHLPVGVYVVRGGGQARRLLVE